MSAFSVENLSFTIGTKKILDQISLAVKKGQVLALLGPNGAGKTTLLKTIIGLYQTPAATDNTNKIYINNQIINAWPVHKRVSHGLLYLPQQTSLFEQMSVLENLLLVFEYHEHWQNKTREEFIQEMDTWLERTTLTHSKNQRAQVLSGGQKRKLEVVRTLLMHPSIVLLDEPFAGVDPKSIYELKKIFVDMASDGIGVLISDHHVDQLLSIADHIIVVMAGQIVTRGTVKDILASDHTKNSYLGDQFYNEIAGKFLD